MQNSLRAIAMTLLAVAFSMLYAQETTPNPVSAKLDIHECYVGETFTTTNPDTRYYVTYLEKELFDEYGYDDDATLAEADAQWMKEMADGFDMGIDEVIDQMTYQGDCEDFQASLLPDRDYVLWFHGVADDGTCNTAITRIPFHTKPVQAIAGKISLKAEKTDGGIKVECTPDDPNLYYTLGSVAKDNMYDEMTGEPLSLNDYMQYGFSNALYDYLANEEFDRIFEQMASKGSQTITFGGLQSGVEYCIVAAYLDSEAGICSEIAVVDIDGEGNIVDPTAIGSLRQAPSTTSRLIYDIQGKRMNTTLQALPKGVYIVKEGSRSRKVAK